MPLYEYACPSCDRNFELLVRFGENPPCPECGSMRLEKQLSVPAAHVAGGKTSLPICETPSSSGGCELPQCGSGHCAFGN
jgi:putative FmdB family regulatory protein